MAQLLETLRSLDYGAYLRAAADIAVVAYILYRLILLAKGRRAWQIILGIGVYILLLVGSEYVGFVALNWLLKQVTPLGPVAIVILLYPELRDILERLGRLDFWGAPLQVTQRQDMSLTIERICRATALMAARKTGALIVMERETGLEDVVATGTKLDAEVTTELLGTLFYVGTPLHDGAVVIRANRLIAAGCTLPLSDSPNIAPNVHMRHRAAIGVSENSDAAVIVVSEERGTISLAVGGKLIPGLNEERLRNRLMEAFGQKVAKDPKETKKQERSGFRFGKRRDKKPSLPAEPVRVEPVPPDSLPKEENEP